MPWADIAQFAGILATTVGGVIGYGRLQERVAVHDKELGERVSKDAFEGLKESIKPFQDEVLRRLERIESKQDQINGHPR